MKLRCWVMVGASSSGNDLPPEAYCGHWQGEPAKAANFKVGQWILWQPAPGQPQMTLVCIDIPM